MKLLGVVWLLVAISFTEQTRMTVIEEMRTVAEANNNFATRFAKYLKGASSGDNAVFSPVSASSVLAGLTEGAGGATRTQLLAALGLADDHETIRSGYRIVVNSYDSSSKGNVTLNMADAFFVSNHFTPKASFVSTMQRDFKSEVQTLNFAAANVAVDKINSWVSEHTNGRIDKLYESGDLSPSTLLVLANAVYFKGTWKVSFDKQETTKRRFYLSSTQTADVDMMTVTSDFVVYSDDTLKANVLEIPYSGEEMKMVLVLPYETDGLEKTIQNMKSVPKLSVNAFAMKYKIYVPKFKITQTINVGEMLESFGVTDAFSAKANFSEISSESIVVDSVKQKAFVEVNEEGTEAAAATGVAGGAAGSVDPPRPTPIFEVNHPFLYFILHIPTDTVVFGGYILSP